MGRYSVCGNALCVESDILKSTPLYKTKYAIFFENGWSPWLAYQTDTKESALEFLSKHTALYIYLHVIDENDGLVVAWCVTSTGKIELIRFLETVIP